jgi:cell division protein FtsW (lipid II flippase)
MTARLTTDWKLFVPILLLLAFGLVMVYSASSVVAEVVYERPIWEFAYKQLRFAGLGLVILFHSGLSS